MWWIAGGAVAIVVIALALAWGLPDFLLKALDAWWKDESDGYH